MPIPMDRNSLSALNLPGGASSKAVAALAAYEGLNKLQDAAKQYWRRHFEYGVSIEEKDPLYGDVHNWLLSVMPNDKHKSLRVSSAARYDDDILSMDEADEQRRTVPPLKVRFDDKATRRLMIDKHMITIRLVTPDLNSTAQLTREPEGSKIIFTSPSYAGQQAVIAQLQKINADRVTGRKPMLRMVNQWGNWRNRSDLPPRTLDSVALPVSQKARIVADVETFLASEEKYNKLALPWHRGYMFEGPPGTGKTSLAKALANHFNLDLWYISIADLKAEASLMTLLSEVGPRSILLLEDIDTMKISHDRDGAEQGTISMSSLLNAIDGVGTPHGLIKMMTTNRFHVLDPALTRPGRMDLIERIDYPTGQTIGQMYNHFFGMKPTWLDDMDDEPIQGLSTAEVVETLKHNMDDAEAANKGLAEVIDSARTKAYLLNH